MRMEPLLDQRRPTRAGLNPAMDALHVGHLVVLGLWGGLVLGECVLELSAQNDTEIRFTARIHYWIDLIVELPLLLGVLVTGAWLTLRVWPPSPLLWVKIAAASAAVAANLVCLVLVILRHRRASDVVALRRLHVQLRYTVGVGLLCGGAAAYLGFTRFLG